MVATHVINVIWSDVSHHEPLSITCVWRVKPSIQPLPSLKLSQLNDTHKASHAVSVWTLTHTRTHCHPHARTPHFFLKDPIISLRARIAWVLSFSPPSLPSSVMIPFFLAPPQALFLCCCCGVSCSHFIGRPGSPHRKETPNEETSSCGREGRRSSKGGRMRL